MLPSEISTSLSFSSNLFQSHIPICKTISFVFIKHPPKLKIMEILFLGEIKAGENSRRIRNFDYRMKPSRFRSTFATNNYQGPRRTGLGKVAMPIPINLLDRGTPGVSLMV